MSARHTHLSTPYYRPRSMGGDVTQPLCMKPHVGWVGQRYACWPMTEVAAKVDCPWCVSRMAGVRLSNSWRQAA